MVDRAALDLRLPGCRCQGRRLRCTLHRLERAEPADEMLLERVEILAHVTFGAIRSDR